MPPQSGTKAGKQRASPSHSIGDGMFVGFRSAAAISNARRSVTRPWL